MFFLGSKFEKSRFCEMVAKRNFGVTEFDSVVQIGLVPFSKALRGDFRAKLGPNLRTVTRTTLSTFSSDFTLEYTIFHEILNTPKMC